MNPTQVIDGGKSVFAKLRETLGKAVPEAAPLTKEQLIQAANERAAKARIDQLNSGVIPDRGRGSSGGQTRLPEGKSWAPHTGDRQRLRTMRQAWNQFEKVCQKDSRAASARERLLDSVQDQPNPEVAALHIILGAKLAADEKRDWLRKNPPPPGTVVTALWADALIAALDYWDQVDAKTKADAAAAGAAL
jgi:hypothetical protein